MSTQGIGPTVAGENQSRQASASLRAGSVWVGIGTQLALLGLFTVAMAATYSTALILNYGMNDDYGLLDQALFHYAGQHAHPEQISSSLSAQGRPLFGWMVRIAFLRGRSLPSLRIVRGIGIFGLGLTAWALHWLLRRAGWKPITSIAMGIIFCTVPAIQVFATWATFFPALFALLEAVGAGLLANWILDGGGSRHWLTPLSALLLICSVITYQPAAMVFVALTLIDGYAPARQTDPFWKKFVRMAFFQGINGVALVGGFVAFRIGLRMYPDYAIPGRTGFAADWRTKPAWFVQYPLTDALNLWNLHAMGVLAGVAGGMLLIGLLFYFKDGRSRALGILICALAFPVAHLPNLLAERSDSYRTQIGLSWVVVALSLLAGAGVVGAISRCACATVGFVRRSATRLQAPDTRSTRGFDPLPGWLVGGVATLAMCAAGYTSTQYITVPHAFELVVLRRQLARPGIAADHHLVFLLLENWQDTAAPAWISDEFGNPTIANYTAGLPWAQVGACYLIDRETDRNADHREIEPIPFFHGVYSKPLSPGSGLIDMRGMGARHEE